MTEFLTPTETASDASMLQVDVAAESELGELFRGGLQILPDGTQPPVEAAAPAPATAPATAPLGADQTLLAGTSPTQPLVNTPEPAKPAVDESVKRFRDMYAGDEVAAAKAALDTNTRAAQMANKLKELGLDPKTLQPIQGAPPKVEQTPSAAPLDEATIQAEINRVLDGDPTFSSAVQAFVANKAELGTIQSERKGVETATLQAQLALKIPQVQADPYEVQKLEALIERNETKLMRMDQREALLESKQDRLNALADSANARARAAITSEYQRWADSRQEEVEFETLQVQYKAEFETAFPNAIDRAIKDFGIPESEVAAFKAETKTHALASVALEQPIENVHEFVAARAKDLMERYDRYHRGKSAEYAKAVTARTQAATATSPLPTVVSSPTTNPNQPEKSLYEFERELADEAALVARQMGLFG